MICRMTDICLQWFLARQADGIRLDRSNPITEISDTRYNEAVPFGGDYSLSLLLGPFHRDPRLDVLNLNGGQ